MTRLLRAACWLSLLGLAVMAISIVFPRPLAVIGAMSAGHAIGALALGCYLAAVIADVNRRTPNGSASVDASPSPRSETRPELTP